MQGSTSSYKRAWVALLLFSVVIINYMDRIALSIASKSIVAQFHFTPVQMGYLFSAFLWTYVLCLVPFGLLTEKIGAKRMVGAGIALWSLATAATAATTGLASLFAARLTMGGSEATTYPASARAIRSWFPEKERGMVTTLFNGGSSAGPAVGALAAAALVSHFGWKIAFIALGAIGFVWLAAWQIWFDEPEKVSWLSAGERDLILTERNGKDEGAAIQHASPSSLLYLISQRSVWGLIVTQACLVYTAYLFLTWLPTFLQSTRELSTMNTGYLTAVPYIATLLLSVSFAWISDRTLSSSAVQAGKRRNFVAVMALLSTTILFASQVKELWQLVLILILVLTGATTGAGLNFTLASDLLRNSRDVSMVIAITALGGNLFGLLAPILTGYIVAGPGGYRSAFLVAAALLLCGAIATLTMTRIPIRAEFYPDVTFERFSAKALQVKECR